jgi:hypothetical protein
MTRTDLFAVSSKYGFVGVFDSVDSIKTLQQTFEYIKFIVHKFKSEDPGSEVAWVVLYKDINIAAFVSDCKKNAILVQSLYLEMEVTYDDDIKYWCKEINEISKHVENRLGFENLNSSGINFPDIFEMLEDLNTSYPAHIVDESKNIFRCTVPFVSNSSGIEEAPAEARSAAEEAPAEARSAAEEAPAEARSAAEEAPIADKSSTVEEPVIEEM